MIEDKKDKIKIAESPIEALWENVKKESEALIKQSENNLIIQKAMNEMAKSKLKELQKRKV